MQLLPSELHICGPGINCYRLLINVSAGGLHIGENLIQQTAELYCLRNHASPIFIYLHVLY